MITVCTRQPLQPQFSEADIDTSLANVCFVRIAAVPGFYLLNLLDWFRRMTVSSPQCEFGFGAVRALGIGIPTSK